MHRLDPLDSDLMLLANIQREWTFSQPKRNIITRNDNKKKKKKKENRKREPVIGLKRTLTARCFLFGHHNREEEEEEEEKLVRPFFFALYKWNSAWSVRIARLSIMRADPPCVMMSAASSKYPLAVFLASSASATSRKIEKKRENIHKQT